MNNHQQQGGFQCNEECQIKKQQNVDLKADIITKIVKNIPANQLAQDRRPNQMKPRTLFLQRKFYLLEKQLNNSCIEHIDNYEKQKMLKTQLSNQQNNQQINNQSCLIQDYFKNHYFCIYDKLKQIKNDNKSFMGKFKGVDTLIDYNWKFFKQLIQPSGTIMNSKFDSDFQCGNLCKAYEQKQNNNNNYFLIIQNDVNTYGYNNWFFYRYRNKNSKKAKFIIPNLIKFSHFYSLGMKISVFSKNKNKYQNIGWYKSGYNINITQNKFPRQHHNKEYYYTLSFQYDFQYLDDQVYFAMSQPYTYTRLATFLQNKIPVIKHFQISYQVKNIGYSISNNLIPAIRIYKTNQIKNEAIFIIARQHPCQTVGSFIAQYLIKILIQMKQFTSQLFKNYQFYVVPMANPDGVIHGMSRANISGIDLNRHWNGGLKQLKPQICKISQFVSSIQKTKIIKYMFDIHGHGKKLNSFLYCCKQKNNDKDLYSYKAFATILSRLQQRVQFQSCTYGIDRQKTNTIRAKINNMGIKHSYTLQTSLFGYINKQKQIKQFNQQDYQSIAKNLLKSVLILQSNNQNFQKFMGINRQNLILQSIKQKQQQEKNKKYKNYEYLDDSDEQDQLDIKQLLKRCQNKIFKKKIKQVFDVKKQKINNNKQKILNKKAFQSFQAQRNKKNNIQKIVINYFKK